MIINRKLSPSVVVSANIFMVSEFFPFNNPDSFFSMASEFSLSSSSFQPSNPYDHHQTLFLQLSCLEKPTSPSPWESRHVGLCWWNYGSTASLWNRNLLNTQPQIFGVESSQSMTSLSPALLSHWGSHCCHRCLSTTRDVWLALETTFSHHSKARELRLKNDLQQMKRGTKLVAEYARAFKTICDQLHVIGRPVENIDKVQWFIHGLDTDFFSFFYCSDGPTPIPCFADLVSKVESFKLFHRSLESSDSTPTTFIATNHGHVGFR